MARPKKQTADERRAAQAARKRGQREREKAAQQEEPHESGFIKRDIRRSEAKNAVAQLISDSAKPQVEGHFSPKSNSQAPVSVEPCLIGSTHASHANPVLSACKSGRDFQGLGHASIDMVRLSVKLESPAKGEELAGVLSRCTIDLDCDMQYFGGVPSPGKWRDLRVYGSGASTVTVGIGLASPSCRVEMSRCFMEFNPNKVQGEVLDRLLDTVGSCATRCELSRYDLALDVPVQRNAVRMAKDRRKYECVISNGMTEYLGQRSAPGRVKVYDKAAELGHAGEALTRIELTCDGEWTAAQVVRQWPRVYSYGRDGGGRTTAMLTTIAMTLSDLAADGHAVEPYVRDLDSRTRQKVLALMETAEIPMTDECAAWGVADAHRWCRRVVR